MQEDAIDQQQGTGARGGFRCTVEHHLELDVVHGAHPRLTGPERVDQPVPDRVVVVAVAVERLGRPTPRVALLPRSVEAVDGRAVHLPARSDKCGQLAAQHGLARAVDTVERDHHATAGAQRHQVLGELAEHLRPATRRRRRDDRVEATRRHPAAWLS